MVIIKLIITIIQKWYNRIRNKDTHVKDEEILDKVYYRNMKHDDDVYYDEQTNKYVRINTLGIKEYLDPASYKESLESEKYYDDLLKSYIKNIREHD